MMRAGAWVTAESFVPLVRAAQVETVDTRALDMLLCAVRRTVLPYFTRRTDAETADDLAQVVLMTVARDYRSVDAECVASWLVTVALNALRDELRRRAFATDRFVRTQHVAHDLTAAEPMSAASEYQELRAAVTGAANDRCGPAVRDAVAGIIDGLTVRDIADLSGTSPHTIRMRLQRARAALASVLPLLR